MASATRSQEWSSTPSSRRNYVVVTASDEWSRNALTVSTDSPASRRSYAAKLEGNDMPNARLVYERSAEPEWVIRT
jgi:hypothetical protein